MKRIQFFSEIGRSKLSAHIGMEHDALRNASVADSVPESLQGEEPVQPGANPVSNTLLAKRSRITQR